MSDESNECIHMPREQSATLASDFHNALATLRMCQDRVLGGLPLHVRRPEWMNPKADPIANLRNGVRRIIDDIFATAVVDEPDG